MTSSSKLGRICRVLCIAIEFNKASTSVGDRSPRRTERINRPKVPWVVRLSEVAASLAAVPSVSSVPIERSRHRANAARSRRWHSSGQKWTRPRGARSEFHCAATPGAGVEQPPTKRLPEPISPENRRVRQARQVRPDVSAALHRQPRLAHQSSPCSAQVTSSRTKRSASTS